MSALYCHLFVGCSVTFVVQIAKAATVTEVKAENGDVATTLTFSFSGGETKL